MVAFLSYLEALKLWEVNYWDSSAHWISMNEEAVCTHQDFSLKDCATLELASLAICLHMIGWVKIGNTTQG